ncbi:MAG: response regulator [Actinomycetota bacterium]
MSNQPVYKILLADDDPGVSKTLAMVLASAGYEVSTAAHAIDAIFHVQASLPDVILYELNLPTAPGYDFLSVIRSRYPQISIIGMGSSPMLDASVPDGVLADAFYVKGQSGPEELLSQVTALIQTSATRAAKRQTNGRRAQALSRE